MADHTQTITNSMGVFGGSEPTLWNDFLWGTGLWGYTNEIIDDVDKGPFVETITLTDGISKHVELTIGDSLTLTGSIESIMKSWGIWDTVFTRPTTDGDSKVFDDSTRVSDPSDDFTQVADGSTPWTGVV